MLLAFSFVYNSSIKIDLNILNPKDTLLQGKDTIALHSKKKYNSNILDKEVCGYCRKKKNLSSHPHHLYQITLHVFYTQVFGTEMKNNQYHVCLQIKDKPDMDCLLSEEVSVCNFDPDVTVKEKLERPTP